ncbi:D-alanyl-D-alanine carboxypeptidase [Streptomyces sp. NPDC004959]|uniref:D-alanyl-D-alanine carboxypeptidase family protein n=1 Tax=Streptomyces sp. NPDC004959 TaxID=3154673 RepID=UPI00068E332F|nr:D-alanyl-D-alanine carboxypeptidase [Streptomyces sp. NRRL F-5630]
MLSLTACAAAAALSLSVVASPALADSGEDSASPRPPARASAIGGARLALPGTQVEPRAGAPKLPKKLTARSWVVADAESGEILAAHNPHWKLAPASTLKMLFADTLLPKFSKDKVHQVTLKDLDGIGEGSSLVGIKEDLPYSVHDLWLGVFLRSGNDAVHVLSSMNGGVARTVQDMRARAHELQADDTHVVTPDGYDAKGQVSSAYDLTLFARDGLKNADFREYCSTAEAQFPGEFAKKKDKEKGEEKATKGQAGPEQKPREHFGIQNTNRLLTGTVDLKPYQGIAGVKNGNTTNAGATYTAYAQRGDRKLLVTVMHPDYDETQAVYREAARLLDWGFAADGKVAPVGELVPPRGVVAERARASKEAAPKHAAGGGGSGGAASATGADSGSGGLGTALAVTGSVLVALAGVVFVVRRRRPLPAGPGTNGGIGTGGTAGPGGTGPGAETTAPDPDATGTGAGPAPRD